MRSPLRLFVLIFLLTGCVDRLDVVQADQQEGILVVDGLITDAPGPYKVKLFRVSASDAILNNFEFIQARQVTIFDDAGTSEVLTRDEKGIYETDPNGIRGEVGRKYSIRIEMLDGLIFESEPDEMMPVGSVDSLYYTWESFVPLSGPTEYGFRVFLNATSQEQPRLRWRFTGTYEIESFPEFRKLNDANCATGPPIPPPEPPPCSGWRYIRNSLNNPFAGGTLEQFSEECTCCICWIPDSGNGPHLSEDVFQSDNTYTEIEVGYVPFSEWTFGRGKYMVKAEQMSLSNTAFQFWKVFKDQKQGATSLFQPAFGKSRTNLYSTNSDEPVMGIFYASAVRSKVMFLTASDAPIKVPPYDFEPLSSNCVLWTDCRTLSAFPNGSNTPPPEWQ